MTVKLLRGNHVVNKAGHFRDRGNAALAVGQAADLHNEIQCIGDLPAQADLTALKAGKTCQHFHAMQAFTSRTGMDGGHRSIVPRVHGLQHFQHLGTAYLTHHNAVGAHAQAVAQQITNRHHTRTIKATGAAFHAHDMRVRQGQLGRVFDRHHALICGNKARNRVEHRGFAAACATTNQDVAALTHGQFQQARHALVQRAELDHILHTQRIAAEFANRDCRPVKRQRLNHHIDAPAIGQAGIHHGSRFIQPAPQWRDDAAHDAQHMGVVGKVKRLLLQHPFARDKHALVAIDQDVFYFGVSHQVIKRPEP